VHAPEVWGEGVAHPWIFPDMNVTLRSFEKSSLLQSEQLKM
jgi:hypothetical protein